MVRPMDIELYVIDDGKILLEDWLNGFRDRKAWAVVDAWVARLRLELAGH